MWTGGQGPGPSQQSLFLGKGDTDTTALSFIRDLIKVKPLGVRESYLEGTKAHQASSDIIVNHRLRLFGRITASFQVQIIVRVLLWTLRKKTKNRKHRG